MCKGPHWQPGWQPGTRGRLVGALLTHSTPACLTSCSGLQAELSEAAALAQPQLIARPPQQLRSPTRRSECSRPSSWSAEASGPSHGQPGRIRAEAATSTAMARLASSADELAARRFRGAQKCRYGAVRYTLLTAYQGPRAVAPRRPPGGPITAQTSRGRLWRAVSTTGGHTTRRRTLPARAYEVRARVRRISFFLG